MKISKHFKIHPFLCLFFLLFFFTGQWRLFLVTMLFVTIHELSHSIAAIACGAKLSEIWITPIGQRAMIKHMERLSLGKQTTILLAGPMVNIIFFLFCVIILPKNAWTIESGGVNFCIGMFNLLPILPLDGGRTVLLWGGSFFGTLRTAAFLTKMSRAFGMGIMALGVLQLTLYPFNFSLLLIGLYIQKFNQEEYSRIAFQFLKTMMGRARRKVKAVKLLQAEKETRVMELVAKFDALHYYTILTEDNCKRLHFMTEERVFSLLFEKGATACLSDGLCEDG